MPRRHPLLKALGGVVVLLAVAGTAGLMGVRVVQRMVDENGQSRLERFANGNDSPSVATIGDPTARITLKLPAPPETNQHESLTYLGRIRQVDRVISPAGGDSVVVVWFDVVPAMALNPEATLKSLASAHAGNLGGSPIDERVVSTGTVAKLDFQVAASKATGGNQYWVTILMRGDLVYIVRVEAKSGGAKALAKVVGSIVWSKAPART